MQISQDKKYHFLAGALVAGVASLAWILVSALGIVHLYEAAIVAPIAAAAAGATKEVADYLDNRRSPGMHGVEWGDFFATMAGSLPVSLAFLALSNLSRQQ